MTDSDDLLNISQLQDKLAEVRGQRPHWRLIRSAIAQGMPHRVDPMRPGRVLFYWPDVEAWYGAKVEKTHTLDTKAKGRIAAARRAG